MPHNLISWIVALVAFGFLIFVHELGHFLVAKLSGIRVEVFSLGFGPMLAGFTAGGTLYKISAFPLGGYVKPAGENEEGRTHQPDEFLSKSWWVRALMLAAGPGMNFVFPVLVLFVLYATVGKPFSLGPATVIAVMEGRPAAQAGMKPGDQFENVDGIPVKSYKELPVLVDGQARSHPGKPLRIGLKRDGRPLNLDILPHPEGPHYRIGVQFGPGMPVLLKTVGRVLVGTPAERAGFQAGDEILSVDGKALADGSAFSPLFADSSQDPVPVEILRNGERRVLRTPRKQPLPPGVAQPELIGLLGLELKSESNTTYEKMSPWMAAKFSFLENVSLGGAMLEGIWSVLTGQVKVRESVGGPITILRMAHQEAESGPGDFINFIASISIMLCVMNLLPIPVLDGGTLLLCLVEGLRGRPLSMKAQVVLQNIGIALIVSLMLFAFYNDIANQHLIRK
jgi:regulator of sigma E protease